MMLKKISVLAVAAMAVVLFPAACFADEPAQVVEEVVVTGAVRGNGSVKIADIDLPGDKVLKEIPVAYE